MPGALYPMGTTQKFHNCPFRQDIIAKSRIEIWSIPMKLDQAIQQHLEKLPLALQGEVLDYVLYLEQKTVKPFPSGNERRKSLANALEKAAALNPYAEVDPAAWVREQRDERTLPGRD
jgi:hypothetical protein